LTVNDRSRDLTPKQQLAVSVLLATGSTAKAAEAAGVGERQLRRWRATPEFLDALRTAGRRSADEATSHLLAAQLEAVTTLRQMLRTGTPAVRVRAARALLELGLKVADGEIDDRLDRLEQSWQAAAAASEPPGLRAVSDV
jgi:hypothetical protein